MVDPGSIWFNRVISPFGTITRFSIFHLEICLLVPMVAVADVHCTMYRSLYIGHKLPCASINCFPLSLNIEDELTSKGVPKGGVR
jgi:hypothetical protein